MTKIIEHLLYVSHFVRDRMKCWFLLHKHTEDRSKGMRIMQWRVVWGPVPGEQKCSAEKEQCGSWTKGGVILIKDFDVGEINNK